MLDSPLGTSVVLLVAFAIDRWQGEPRAALHPVVWIGRATSRLLHFAPERGPKRQLAFGILIACVVPGLTAGVALATSFGLDETTRAGVALLAGGGRAAGAGAALLVGIELAARAWILKTLFAMRALGDAASAVRSALGSGDLPRARTGLASLCSRDASALDAPDLVAATVESVAENTSDSIVAPLLFFLLLGLPGAAFYRAANTLDAMIGYRGRFEHLGKAAARLDDLLNLVPARLTALLLLAGGTLAGADVRNGVRMLRRDAHRTESPNAGWPMAAMAGLLGVALEKSGHYRLGDARAPLRPETIDAAWRIVTRATATGAVALAAAGVLAGLSE